MEREGWGVSQRYEGRGLGGRRGGRGKPRHEVWRSLDWMLSCCCCFERVENNRLVLSCLFTDALVLWWTWVGEEEGAEGGRREPVLMIV